ncbi:hypothetical protein O2W18_19635 [Modestobacter sp. VKM Ac-2983]|uniref:hypothetical protein n=1 Tax=Modestobacter sp. VKM Ac-2983 TaxID=3004137 RepID=UPI0022AB9FDE|nr:hypothetical protein [Modestobacter sp. VKM Ac-2983]MCZ2807323.1 hypothetical protein [Modestobacter sp. VKM Ac-2983]
MDVGSVDPRDVRWEIDEPRYRVHFWTESADPVTGTIGRGADEQELSGPDVHGAAVLAWAADEAAERGADWFEVFVVVDRTPGDRGLVRLTPLR